MDEMIAALVLLLNGSAGRDNGFSSAERIEGEPAVGVELDGELYFLTVAPA